MKTYYIGLVKGSGRCYPLHSNGHDTGTLVVEMRQNIDALSCDLWQYYGKREITKKQMFQNRFDFLAEINWVEGTNFKRIVFD